jgi:hypothetical protein
MRFVLLAFALIGVAAAALSSIPPLKTKQISTPFNGVRVHAELNEQKKKKQPPPKTKSNFYWLL